MILILKSQQGKLKNVLAIDLDKNVPTLKEWAHNLKKYLDLKKHHENKKWARSKSELVLNP